MQSIPYFLPYYHQGFVLRVYHLLFKHPGNFLMTHNLLPVVQIVNALLLHVTLANQVEIAQVVDLVNLLEVLFGVHDKPSLVEAVFVDALSFEVFVLLESLLVLL